VIANNSEKNIGGGGELRAPLAGALGEIDNSRLTPPSAIVVTATGTQTAELEWKGGSHPLGISNYWIYGNGKKIGETFGKTSVTVTGLTPGTEYEFTVRTRSRNLMLSPGCLGIFARTEPVAPGTVVQDFDSGEAPGWRFEGGAAIRGSRMELHNWSGIATAVLDEPELPSAFTLIADLDHVGNGSSNRTQIHLDYKRYNTTVYLEIPGGDKPVTLRQRKDGKDTILATSTATWNNAQSFSIIITEEPRTLTFCAIRGGKSLPVFSKIPLAAPVGGHLALSTLANSANFDNLSLHPSK